MYTGIILLDLQKPFDTVNHEIMIQKLKAVGVDHNTTNWFHSYLIDRRQFVSLGGHQIIYQPNLLWCSAGLNTWASPVSTLY